MHLEHPAGGGSTDCPGQELKPHLNSMQSISSGPRWFNNRVTEADSTFTDHCCAHTLPFRAISLCDSDSPFTDPSHQSHTMSAPPPPPRGGMSLYANLLESDSSASISRDPVVFTKEDNAPAKKHIDPGTPTPPNSPFPISNPPPVQPSASNPSAAPNSNSPTNQNPPPPSPNPSPPQPPPTPPPTLPPRAPPSPTGPPPSTTPTTTTKKRSSNAAAASKRSAKRPPPTPPKPRPTGTRSTTPRARPTSTSTCAATSASPSCASGRGCCMRTGGGGGGRAPTTAATEGMTDGTGARRSRRRRPSRLRPRPSLRPGPSTSTRQQATTRMPGGLRSLAPPPLPLPLLRPTPAAAVPSPAPQSGTHPHPHHPHPPTSSRSTIWTSTQPRPPPPAAPAKQVSQPASWPNTAGLAARASAPPHQASPRRSGSTSKSRNKTKRAGGEVRLSLPRRDNPPRPPPPAKQARWFYWRICSRGWRMSKARWRPGWGRRLVRSAGRGMEGWRGLLLMPGAGGCLSGLWRGLVL